ncbi:hypothetical protein H2199_000244 [Coniosporium tulheliwenetii]|uniref:Uncharacterized protein n=1 Tax=Coniosporium tulheliwenetii TaxID=3383036 RepID=A0ACC2ZPJ9_9PEZI|nr:hypothetical protein H2199_000244 [Cladosporium sp. JES 115]
MSSVSSSSSSGSKPDKIDPVLRNALRYTVSAKEYKLLHRYLISRAPAVKKRTPPPPRYEAIVKGGDDYNAAAIRASLRLAITTYGALKAWEYFTTKVLARGRVVQPKAKTSLWKSPNVRLSCSLSLILLFHRLLHRFFTRLRESLLTDQAKPFRRRNPRVSRTLTSRLAPAIGASLSGFFLGVYPGDQLRITIAIYVFTRALEFVYNGLEDRGWFKNRPWWFGSWLCMPVACGQLLHAFVFDRDCFPESYGEFILNHSPQYIQTRPATYPSHLAWPSTFSIVDNLAEISRLKWPPFVSPILFPNAQTLPASVRAIAPITSPAHPAIKSLSCALLHPHDPSCLRTYVSYWIQAFPPVARFFALVFSAMGILRYKAFAADPVKAAARLVKSVLRMSLFITGSIGTSWASICLFAHYLPRNVLPTKRWFLGGVLGGARLSLDSLWKVGVKHGWWRGVRNGDVLLFVASLAVVNAVYEIDPKAVSGGVVRKGLGMLRGEGWVDRAALSGGAAGNAAGGGDGVGEGEARMREREIKNTGVEILDGEEEELEKRE